MARPTSWALLGLATAAMLIQMWVVPIDADVSWLITVSERVLAGQRLYIDVFEVNPPASVWLYLPQVALAQALGIRPEALIVTATTLAAIGSTMFASRLCRSLHGSPSPLFTTILFGMVTLVLPGGLYAQREHYALLLILPVAALMARMADGRRPNGPMIIAAGAASGLVIVIKPFFLLTVLLPAVYVAVSGRRWRQTLLAGASAALVIAAYGTAIVVASPAYLDAVPMLAEIYGPMRDRTTSLLTGSAVLTPLALVGLAWILRAGALAKFQIILAFAIVGFTLAVIIQGKGYWNHALPGLGLGLVMLGWSVLSPAQRRERRRVGGAAFTALGIALLYATLSVQPPPGLVATLQAVAPANPTMITVGTELATGHPAVRLVNGQWAGTRASLFTAAGVRYRTANRTRNLTPELERWYRDDLDILARDIKRNPPAVILVEDKSRSWLLADPAIHQVMRDYREAARAGKIAIWLRLGQ